MTADEQTLSGLLSDLAVAHNMSTYYSNQAMRVEIAIAVLTGRMEREGYEGLPAPILVGPLRQERPSPQAVFNELYPKLNGQTLSTADFISLCINKGCGGNETVAPWANTVLSNACKNNKLKRISRGIYQRNEQA